MPVKFEVVSLVAKASNQKCTAMQVLHSCKEASKKGLGGWHCAKAGSRQAMAQARLTPVPPPRSTHTIPSDWAGSRAAQAASMGFLPHRKLVRKASSAAVGTQGIREGAPIVMHHLCKALTGWP